MERSSHLPELQQSANGTGPTLSVLLPCKDDRWRLGTQLEAILKQLRPCDELILLADGSDARTRWVMDQFTEPQIKRFSNAEPSGVCGAYNQCAALARGEWLLGASGNDEVQPGAVSSWLSAAQRFPEARVMFGHIHGWERKPWLPDTGEVLPGWLPAIWLAEGWKTHGAACFLRRDVWGKGYLPELAWFADHFQSMVLTWRYGCVDLHAYISRVNFLPDGFSQSHGDKEKYNRAIRACREEFAKPEYDDVRRHGEVFDKITGWLKEKE